LLQNELTDQAVEDAAINYLENLDEIAFLDVCAVYYDTQRLEMHVFARTKGGDPATYYHRVFEQEQYWTPWDKVDLDITGDHLLAFMRNSRLYLAWPVFTTQANTEQSVNIPNPTALPATGQEADHAKKYYEVQIAISQYTGKKWLPKKLSKEPLRTEVYESLPSKENFRFTLMNMGALGYYILCTYIDDGKVSISSGYASKSNTVIGSFSLTGCKGVPEAKPWNAVIGNFSYLPVFGDTGFLEQRYRELNLVPGDDLYMQMIFNMTGFIMVNNTPGTFKITYPEQMSLIDLLLLLWEMLSYKQTAFRGMNYREGIYIPLGTLMPFFYGDSFRGYAIIPGLFQTPEEEQEAGQVNQRTFSDFLEFTRKAVDLVVRFYALWLQKQFPDFNALWEAMLKDEESVWLANEWAAYHKLHLGHRFKNFYHPLVCYLREILYKDGIPALMKRQTQLYKTNFTFGPGDIYNPTSAVIPAYPIEDLDFSEDGSYSSYNWELFFHLPFEIAVQLSKDQQFESAMEWFHYIFNPTGALEGNVPEKYWVTRPFYEHTQADYVKQRIDTIMNNLAADPEGTNISALKSAVAEWRAKPFMPHVIARSRPVAYQKAVVMK
jgi:hypothetical protein